MRTDYTIGECHVIQSGNESGSGKVIACDPDVGVYVQVYTSADCTTGLALTASYPAHSTDPAICPFYDATAIAVSGNKFGIGMLDSWGLFVCQSLLLGLCGGL